MSERRDSNPRPSAWKANALSTELLSQFNVIMWQCDNLMINTIIITSSYQLIITSFLWAVKDSNLRSRKTAELQSAPVGHFGNYPFFLKQCKDNSFFYYYQIKLAIFIAVMAASMPLFPCIPPALASACCKVLVVSTPKIIGQFSFITFSLAIP